MNEEEEEEEERKKERKQLRTPVRFVTVTCGATTTRPQAGARRPPAPNAWLARQSLRLLINPSTLKLLPSLVSFLFISFCFCKRVVLTNATTGARMYRAAAAAAAAVAALVVWQWCAHTPTVVPRPWPPGDVHFASEVGGSLCQRQDDKKKEIRRKREKTKSLFWQEDQE